MKKELIEYAKGISCKEDVFEWIDKRVPDNFNIGEVEHILDYLGSNKRPKRLDRATYEQMKSNSDKWILSLRKKGNGIIEGSEDVEVVLDFKDGFKFVKLIGQKSYEREGNLMSHCVASYFGRDVEIYSLRDKDNMPHCTIEKNVQIKGKGNGDISPKYIDYVVQFLEWTGMKVRDSEMSNLGYIVPMFPEYIVNQKLYKNKYVRKNVDIKYCENVIVFEDLQEAVNYKGNKICLFKDDANFEGSQITDLGQLTSIGGYANFEGSQITDLGQLTSIGGSAYFRGSQITDLGQLTSIGGDANFEGSQITDLGQLTSIGGDANFEGSQITESEIKRFKELQCQKKED
jgi:hypothetical protein